MFLEDFYKCNKFPVIPEQIPFLSVKTIILRTNHIIPPCLSVKTVILRTNRTDSPMSVQETPILWTKFGRYYKKLANHKVFTSGTT